MRVENLINMLDQFICDAVQQELEELEACVDPSIPASPHYKDWHELTVRFADVLVLTRIVDSLVGYLDDIFCLIDLSSKGLIQPDSFCLHSIDPSDARSVAAAVARFSKLPFPKKLESLALRGVDTTSISNLRKVQDIRKFRNQLVHHAGLAAAFVAHFGSRSRPVDASSFCPDQPLLQPVGANVPLYRSAMENVLTFCAEIDVLAQERFGLGSLPVTLAPLGADGDARDDTE